ncbi:MAG: TSUP family transporter [Flavipsychrobacter sp.]|nr:TSUP family transporter [Flavipsychrobacter sp.]
MLTLVALCFFAFLAGFVDAMVGGGGLIQLPALFILQPQLALTQTLATNKMANFMGTLVAAARYLNRTKPNWGLLAPALPAAFSGSLCGALLVHWINDKSVFLPIIICALAAVLLYTVYQRELGLHPKDKPLSKAKGYVYGVSIGLAIGLYDGVIGPGTGSFLIFAFIVVYGNDFLHASAHAKIVNCVTNIAALALFICKGAVVWSTALPMAAANMLGSYAGAHIALQKGSKLVRVFFIVVVTALIVKLVLDLPGLS